MIDFSRKLPIGVQSFDVMRNDEFLYVDKTKHMYRLIHSNRVYFLSRPRRFGKSLFLSTLKAYFLGKKELFTGLYLEKAEADRAKQSGNRAWIEYPVLYLDFNTGRYDLPGALGASLDYFLKYEEQKYGIEASSSASESFAQRFASLIRTAYEKTGKQAVILVDEYDKPLLQTMHTDAQLNENYRNELKAFYSVLKTCDEYIRFTFLTGVTKFSKVSIFSDLNNLQDISMLNDYADICGITQPELEAVFEPEIQRLADDNNMSYKKALAELKKRYDGYYFSTEGPAVYNPFSILNTFSSRQFKNYWFATGTPTFLVEYLKEAQYNIPDLDGKVELNEAGLTDYRANSKNPLPILFQAGYLTIKGYDSEYAVYRLGFPNEEVRYGFLQNLLPAYSDLDFTETSFSVVQFTKDIRADNVDGFMERMRSIISGIPYDNFSEKDIKLREQNYQTAVYLIFALMGQFVQTEVHCATGRADCIVQTETAVYIFEFKLNGTGCAEDAIAQIRSRGYADPYRICGKKIRAVGSSFDENTRTIKDWKVEDI